MSDMREAVEKAVEEGSVLIDKEGLSQLYESVPKIAGLGLGGILYTAGRKAGLRGATLLKEKLGLKGSKLIDAMVIAFEAGHWGRMEVEPANNGGLYHVKVTENILVAALDKTKKKPTCHPLSGYIAGFFELAVEDKVQVKELECIGAGDTACVFEVKTG